MQPTNESKKNGNPAKGYTMVICEKVESGDISPNEGACILKWLEWKTDTSDRTRKILAFIMFRVARYSHETGQDLTNMQGDTIMHIVNRIKKDSPKQNGRQKILTTLKNYCQFRNVFGEKIDNLDFILKTIKPGKSDWNAKTDHDLITVDQFREIMEKAPMNAQEKALLMVMWDGYLRAYEPYLLKWNDLKKNEKGTRTYTITFKTKRPRTIVMQESTVKYLELLRELQGESWESKNPIFPTQEGTGHRSINASTRLFKRLSIACDLPQLKPGCIRNSAITHDGYTKDLKEICMRAWGVPYTDMINVYLRSDSEKMQIKNGIENINVIPKVFQNETDRMQSEIDMLKKQVFELLKANAAR